MSRFNPGDLVSGKYRIVRLIGDGGMGVVYEARHEVLGSGVALKFLHAELAKRPGLTQRFLQEARVSATIQSPHVTHVTDVDTAQDGSPYLVMELLSGQSLQALLDWHRRLPVDQAVDFGLQILAGLEAAHAMGVVHRDMKPDNVFVTATGGGPLLKLIDFGIAKLRVATEYNKGLTRAGVVMGTPEYMAPEQLVSANTTDHRADIYSLGVMLFEMLGGCRPADGDDVEVIVAAVESGRVRRLREVAPEVPEGLVAIVERATLPNREARFESASAMRLALAHFAGQLSHAGRLAAIAPPLAPIPAPASVVLSSFPPPNMSAAVAAHPNTSVPKTVPPDAPLSVSQLGAARTSLSHDELQQPAPFRGTEMGGPAAFGAPPAQYGPPPVYQGLPLQGVQPARAKRRSGLLITVLALAVIGGGGAVGYAAYRAADTSRIVAPPLPEDVALPTPTTASTVEQINAETPDVSSTTTTPLPGVPTTKPATTSTGTKPSTGTATPGTAGNTGNGQVVVGGGGTGTTIQLPFPIPTGIQIPTTLPSIQLPPGLTFPPGFPGVPQPTTTTAPTATPTATPAPTGASPTPTPTTAPAPRPRQSSRP